MTIGPISGMGYLIHFHELESSLGGIWEKIMSEESLDGSRSKIFLVLFMYCSMDANSSLVKVSPLLC